MDNLRVLGVGRDAENEKAVLLCCNRRPSDDEMRVIHAILRQPLEYSEAAHIAHDMRAGLFPERSSIDAYVASALRATSPAE